MESASQLSQSGLINTKKISISILFYFLLGSLYGTSKQMLKSMNQTVLEERSVRKNCAEYVAHRSHEEN
ncbi:MAG: hypothetical protein R2788_02280 [Saprospiraceae bacterium]